jgi:Domain of unknown function (DUF4258)
VNIKPVMIEYRIHALQRMWQRKITPDEVAAVLEQGDAVEAYPDDTPYPSKLLLAVVNGRPLHVVVAENSNENQLIIITVYQPDLLNWQPGFRERLV